MRNDRWSLKFGPVAGFGGLAFGPGAGAAGLSIAAILAAAQWDAVNFPLSLNKINGVWTSDFDRDDYLPDSLWQNTFYVSTTGNNANVGTQASPVKAIWKATALGNATGQPFKVVIAAGEYGRNFGFNASGVQTETTQKAAYVADGKVTVGPWVGTDETLTFTVDATYTSTYKTSRSNVRSVWNLDILDNEELPTEMAYVATPELCNTTLNSWTQSGSDLYVHRADGALPSREVNIRVCLLHATWRRNPTSKDVYVEGIDFFGSGSGDGDVRIESLTDTTVQVFRYCRFISAGSPIGPNLIDGAQINNCPGLFVFQGCESIGNSKDAFNAHWSVDTTRKTFVITEGCRSRFNGKYSLSSCNGITGHDTIVWVDIEGDYEKDHGGEVAYIGDSRIACFGTRAAFDQGDGHATVGFMTADTAEMWLVDCEGEMSNVINPAITANTGSTIHTYSFTAVSGTVGGAGTVSPMEVEVPVGEVGPLPTGGFKSLTIRDTTPIDADGNGVGASGSGWVAEVVLKGLTSTTGQIQARKLRLVVSDPGFDAEGNPTTVERIIYGAACVRRQYPNGGSRMISTDGTDLTLLVALSDHIYTGSTIVSASIHYGFYSSCTPSFAQSVTNNSTVGYKRPVAGWLNTQMEAATGNTKHVELVVFQRDAQQGRQVACIKFTASDGTHTGATSLVNDTTLSTIQTTGNIAEVFAAEVDCSTMTQGALFTVDAVIYPWLGTAYSLKADGYAWPTTLPGTALNILCDRTGAYGAGAVFAYYKAGAGTGTVSATAATARSSPFGTWSTMIAAIKTFMNANKGHNDIGGAVIRLMDTGGADTTLTVGGSWGSSLAGQTWVTVEPDPLNTGLITLTASSNFTAPTMVHWKGVKLTGSGFLIIGPGSTPASGTSNDRTMCWLDGCNFISGGSFSPANYNMWWYKDCTWARSTTLASFATIYDGVVCVLGGSATGNLGAAGNYINVVIGLNYLAPGATALGSSRQNATAADGAMQRIFYNYKAWTGRWQNTGSITPMEDIVIANCLFEMDDSNSNNITCNVFADGDLTTIKNGIEFHNTGVGDRCSHYYNDSAGSNVAPNAVRKEGIARFCIWDNFNIKSDYFSVPSAGSGSPGNWDWLYQVGNHGNVSLFGAVSRSASDAPQNAGIDQYMGCAWQVDSEPNLQLHGLTKAQIMTLFASYTVAPQAVPAMGGNYQPVHAASYITGRVPAGRSVFKYDIGGSLRKTDGTGAAGAYEQAAS